MAKGKQVELLLRTFRDPVLRKDSLEPLSNGIEQQRAFTSATAVCPWKYQVFLSFRDEDSLLIFLFHISIRAIELPYF
ncbi:hypothetical protein L3X38_042211 [Prunus dulcis]|uniref:Uncharacterized protein n=1 Tax=Prunus dulcis TaxID=3755 RepID=A0AAD4UWF0_PRUDU|nr:hypothetical protein L3X38_042211 [Prunus dulcis]